MDTLTKSASDLFKIAVNVAGFDARELMLEINRRQRGRGRANSATVQAAMHKLGGRS